MEITPSSWTTGGDRVILVDHIRAQLRWLSQRPIKLSEQQSAWDNRQGLHLVPLVGDGGSPETFSLGIYAKWLVALDLITETWELGADLAAGLKVTSGAVRQLFDPKVDNGKRLLRKPARYSLVGAQREDADELANVLWCILDAVNVWRAGLSIDDMSVEDFEELQIPVDGGGSAIGSTPLARLRHWFAFGLQPPHSRVAGEVDEQLLLAVMGNARTTAEQIATALDKRAPHQRIVNLWSPRAADTRDAFGAALERALSYSPSPFTTGPAVIRLPLGPGSSRASVLRDLYTNLVSGYAEDEDLVDLDSESDMAVIRDALTLGHFIVIIERWDNAGGPLSSLDQFLCNTNWGEFLRVLAQPNLKAVSGQVLPSWSGSSIVVLSSSPATELQPWCALFAARTDVEELTRHRESQERQVKAAINRLAQVNVHRVHLTVAARLVAASVDGLRRSTLSRCLKQWAALFAYAIAPKTADEKSTKEQVRRELAKWNRAEYCEDLIDELLDRGRFFLCALPDKDNDGVSDAVRQVELNRRPEPPSNKDEAEAGRMLIQFSSRVARAQFVRVWTEGASDQEEGMSTDLRGSLSWGAINFVLADESLRQATVIVRHQENSSHESTDVVRRFVQAAYHGLMGIDERIGSEIGTAPLTGGLYETSIPADPEKRYRFLYRFVYRRCIEAGEWRLGRSMGRSDVRMELLKIFLCPAIGRKLLMHSSEHDLSTRLLPPPFVPEPALPVSDAALRCDLLEALARSGLDTGTARGRIAAEWALSMLPGWRMGTAKGASLSIPDLEAHLINSRLPPRGEQYSRIADAALKVRIDWMQSSGDNDSLSQAESLCTQQLERMGVPSEFVRTLAERASGVVRSAWFNRPGVTNGLRDALDDATNVVLGAVKSPSMQVLAADILFRLAEIVATRADNHESGAQQRLQLASAADRRVEITMQFASACAIYRVADRVRSSAGNSDIDGLKWPGAGARSLRYYVRVCLKLARLLLQGADQLQLGRAVDLAEALLEHAHNRLGMYTRHHFRFRRERISAMLLESARIRTWVRFSSQLAMRELIPKLVTLVAERTVLESYLTLSRRTRSPSKNVIAKDRAHGARVSAISKEVAVLIDALVSRLDAQWIVLEEAASRLEEAEQLQFSLGYQRAHVRRLFLEQAKFATTGASVLAINLPLKLAQEAASSMSSSKDRFPLPRVDELRSSVDELRAKLQKELERVAARRKLRRHLQLAGVAASALSATSAGGQFWEQIARRQADSLGFALARVNQLVEVSDTSSPPVWGA